MLFFTWLFMVVLTNTKHWCVWNTKHNTQKQEYARHQNTSKNTQKKSKNNATLLW